LGRSDKPTGTISIILSHRSSSNYARSKFQMVQPKTTHATKFSPQLVTQFKIVHATGFNGTRGVGRGTGKIGRARLLPSQNGSEQRMANSE
jgi:hypothetical protein